MSRLSEFPTTAHDSSSNFVRFKASGSCCPTQPSVFCATAHNNNAQKHSRTYMHSATPTTHKSAVALLQQELFHCFHTLHSQPWRGCSVFRLLLRTIILVVSGFGCRGHNGLAVEPKSASSWDIESKSRLARVVTTCFICAAQSGKRASTVERPRIEYVYIYIHTRHIASFSLTVGGGGNNSCSRRRRR